MERTTRATLGDVQKLETVIRIRDRIVRVTAEHLLVTLDRGEDIAADLAHLRRAIDEAKDADDAFWATAHGAAS